jgi:hypothetical protein
MFGRAPIATTPICGSVVLGARYGLRTRARDDSVERLASTDSSDYKIPSRDSSEGQP